MEVNNYSGGAWRGLIRNLCFIAFGITAFYNPVDPLNPYSIGFGVVVGMLLGWLFKKFLRGFLGAVNSKLKQEKGKKVIYYAVDNGMLFLIPFAAMVLMATFVLEWSMTSGFISAGIMAVGTTAAIEIGKIIGKRDIKNTVIASGISFLFSLTWTLSAHILVKAPGLVEGGISLLRSILSQGGGS